VVPSRERDERRRRVQAWNHIDVSMADGLIPSIDYSFCAPSVWIVVSGGRDRDMGAGCGGVAACVGAFDCDGVDAMVVVFFLPGTGFFRKQIVVGIVRGIDAPGSGFRGA